MKKIYILITFLAGFICIGVQATNMPYELVEGREFYNMVPGQSPLAEQFTTMVNSPPVPIRVNQKKTVHVAIMLFGQDDSIINQALLLSFRQRMRELEIDYRLDVYTDKTEYGEDLSPYFEMESNQPDYIVMTKLGGIQKRFLDKLLLSNSVKVILYDFASPLSHWMRQSPLMYVGFDQRQVTKRLASYLDRQLPSEAKISALVLPDGYLGHVRCDLFLDEMARFGRDINAIRMVSDNREKASDATAALLKETKADFIFSCSQNISDGVAALLAKRGLASTIKTNAWGLSSNGLLDLKNRAVNISVFFMQDDLSIALAESIKLDIEGRNMPTLYIANATLVPASIGEESLALMIDKAYQYSSILWLK